jgi:hypothetical protein
MSKQMYWGIMCRTCRKLLAFETGLDGSFGRGRASVKPGTIRCSLGHAHIYFPKDFRFYTSATPITETVMEGNRSAYEAINPTAHMA